MSSCFCDHGWTRRPLTATSDDLCYRGITPQTDLLSVRELPRRRIPLRATFPTSLQTPDCGWTLCVLPSKLRHCLDGKRLPYRSGVDVWFCAGVRLYDGVPWSGCCAGPDSKVLPQTVRICRKPANGFGVYPVRLVGSIAGREFAIFIILRKNPRQRITLRIGQNLRRGECVLRRNYHQQRRFRLWTVTGAICLSRSGSTHRAASVSN